jgi:GAF domain-containing protein
MKNIRTPILLDIPESIQNNWQNIIDIAAKILNVPAALIMRIVDSDITVLLSSKTDNNPYTVGAKEQFKDSGLYCETVIKTNKMLLIPNALSDEHWKNNPDIKLNMISYLGFPIVLPDNTHFGTICVLDNKENSYSELYIDLIKHFHDMIERDIELLYMNYTLGEKNKKLNDFLSEIHILRGVLPICANCKKIRDDKGYWNQLEEYFEKYSEVHFSHGLCESCAEKLYGDQEWYKKKR